MKTRLVPAEQPDSVAIALSVLKNNGVVAFPTDTVYGVAASAFNAQAIELLFTAKGRDFNKSIAVLIGDIAQLPQLTDSFTPSARKLAERFWPGALTLVVPRHPSLPNILSPTPTIGVRMPDHAFARAILNAAGPLATTSANLSGGPNPKTAQDVLQQLDGRIDLVLDGGSCPGGVPSTVVDCTLVEPQVLRQGAITAQQLLNALKES
ncbi:MAG TPA: L-threonylcarbamoyladenylate synthase [Longilinea sp.]|nr:L-threonylcarbamoyladenylate synthase [Longilinea sp.]